jgi:hypothetical protein
MSPYWRMDKLGASAGCRPDIFCMDQITLTGVVRLP